MTTETQTTSGPVLAPPSTPAGMYLDLMKRSLTNWVYADTEAEPFDPEKRTAGVDWPPTAHTMIGLRRLDNLQTAVEDVLARGVPGDLIETGVWRGGATILMRAILRAHGCTDRAVWVADSFEGLPPPDAAAFPQDDGDLLHTVDFRLFDPFRG
ncbi:MAG: TylF/MycF/NovP-related O-methyltransferase [Candidatus Dormibacteria bacterium]